MVGGKSLNLFNLFFTLVVPSFYTIVCIPYFYIVKQAWFEVCKRGTTVFCLEYTLNTRQNTLPVIFLNSC